MLASILLSTLIGGALAFHPDTWRGPLTYPDLQARNIIEHGGALYVRAARGRKSAGHSLASAGRGAERGINALGNLGTAVQAATDVYGIFKGKRDVENLFVRDELDG